MKLLYRFLNLTFRRQRYLIAAAFWHLGVRLALRLLPFATVRALSLRCTPSRVPVSDDAVVADVLWSSRAIAQRLPGSGCLAEALATQLLLGRHGHPTRLRVGVRRVDVGELAAHAWLERHGDVLVGGVDSPDQFESVPLASIG